MSDKKTRNRYKQFLHNPNVKVPPSTFYKNKKQINFHNLTATTPNIQNSTHLTDGNSALNNNDSLTDNSVPTHYISEYIIESNNNETNEYENLDILSDIVNENPLNESNHHDFDAEELNNLFDQQEITAEELASAYLVAFFNGSITQKALKDFITLSNISSDIKLPSSFDGLAKLLMKSEHTKNYTKSWFCGVCLTTFDNLNNRFQRSCEKCQVKFNMFYYLDMETQIKKIFSNVDFNYSC